MTSAPASPPDLSACDVTPSRSQVAAAYLLRVLLPGAVMVASTLAVAGLWFMNTHTASATWISWLATMAVGLAGWIMAVWGATTLGQRFRLDRELHRHNGARGWQIASVTLLVLLWVYGVGLLLGMYLLAMAGQILGGMDAVT